MADETQISEENWQAADRAFEDLVKVLDLESPAPEYEVYGPEEYRTGISEPAHRALSAIFRDNAVISFMDVQIVNGEPTNPELITAIVSCVFPGGFSFHRVREKRE